MGEGRGQRPEGEGQVRGEGQRSERGGAEVRHWNDHAVFHP